MSPSARPTNDHYWRRPWAAGLFAGDLFEAIPFGAQPTTIVEGLDEDGQSKHFVGQIAFAYGLLISPTCDIADPTTGEPAHPYRVLIPVVSLEAVCDTIGMGNDKRGLLRSRDQLHPYLYRPTTISDDLLRSPPRRIAQLHPLARRHLKVKLAAYWARARVTPDSLPLFERDEPDPRNETWPPSPYDDGHDTRIADRLPLADWDPSSA
jgi:hypothetical protein